MHRSNKRKLVAALALAIVAAFAGGAYAATQSAGPGTRQAFLDDVARRLHVTPQQLSAALSGATLDQLQAEVKAGRLTQAQANALEQRLKRSGGGPLALPFGPRGPHAFGPLVGRVGIAGGLPAAASYLGLTRAQLSQQLASGKSLAQIAQSKGKSVSGLEQAMTAAVKARLDKAVADKTITQAQEQQLLKRFSSRLSQQVNVKGLALQRGFFRRLPGGGSLPAPPGPQGARPAAPLSQLFQPATPPAPPGGPAPSA